MKGRQEDARKALDKVDKMMLQENFPYGHISRGNMHDRNSIMFLEACYRADAKDLAGKVMKSVKTDLQQQIKFYNSLSEKKAEWMAYERKTAEDYLNALSRLEEIYVKKAGATPEAGNGMINPATPQGQPDGTQQDTSKK